MGVWEIRLEGYLKGERTWFPGSVRILFSPYLPSLRQREEIFVSEKGWASASALQEAIVKVTKKGDH